jgi:hypothetical protein
MFYNDSLVISWKVIDVVQMIVDISEQQNRVLNIIKGKFGFRNKSDAVSYVLQQYETELLEPELRPQYVDKLQKLEKQKGIAFKNMADLRKTLEN